MGFALVGVLVAAGSLNLSDIVNAQAGDAGFLEWFWLPLLLAPNAAGAGAGYLLFAIPIAAAGYVYQIRRFYTYAGLFVLAAVADVMLPFRMPWILVATGATIAAIGAWVLVAYLGRYPAAPAEADA
jgi:hypothetical protein